MLVRLNGIMDGAVHLCHAEEPSDALCRDYYLRRNFIPAHHGIGGGVIRRARRAHDLRSGRSERGEDK